MSAVSKHPLENGNVNTDLTQENNPFNNGELTGVDPYFQVTSPVEVEPKEYDKPKSEESDDDSNDEPKSDAVKPPPSTSLTPPPAK